MLSRECYICERGCHLQDGQSGACGMYELQGDVIVERFPGHYLVACPISIETMPLLHFYPGGKFLQITSTGCNFSCPGCISTVLVHELDHNSLALQHLSAEQVVDKAHAGGCLGIAYVMNDPLAAFPSFLAIAKQAKSKGLLVGCSTNAYFTEQSLQQLLPFLDFINVGLKGFGAAAYRACGAPGIAPVLRNIKTLYSAGVHVEISAILTRSNAQEIEDLAAFLATIARHIPLQIMRFLPFEAAAPELEPSIAAAEQTVTNLRSVLDYVYLFNSPGTTLLDTSCPECGAVQLHRQFYGPMGAKLLPGSGLEREGCGHPIMVRGTVADEQFQEQDFQGGYPFTRALEMVEALLIAMGVTEKRVVARAWEYLLRPGGLQQLHHAIQQPRAYIQLVREFGELVGVSDKAGQLAAFLEERVARVEAAVAGVSEPPRVYYAMGTPLFYINGGRLENELVVMAGGHSCNRELPEGGRPGRNISVKRFNQLNPQVIFISAFIDNNVADFSTLCRHLGLTAEAVAAQQIHVHPAPGWDFGSPRWILGLMNIANILHPEYCQFDVLAEAEQLYREFYQRTFDPTLVNRSFSKPDCQWRWLD